MSAKHRAHCMCSVCYVRQLDMTAAQPDPKPDSAARAALRTILERNGVTDPPQHGEGIHGWRCAHPDRYGPCSCVEELLDDLEAWVTEGVVR